MKLTHEAKRTVKERIRGVRAEVKGCSHPMRLIAVDEAIQSLREDGIRLSPRTVARLRKAV